MGTNYYARQTCPAPCEHCNLADTHIGKGSAGWRFLVDATSGIRNWEDLKAALPTLSLVDEYGDSVDAEDLISYIESKSEGRSHAREYEGWENGPADFLDTEFS